MITKYATPPNNNEMTLQMIIDDEAQTVRTGYFLFVGLSDYWIEKSIIKKIQAAKAKPEEARALLNTPEAQKVAVILDAQTYAKAEAARREFCSRYGRRFGIVRNYRGNGIL